MPGMEAFLANKERARQLAAEQAAREEKAFILNPRDRSAHPLTIPQPFCLRTDLRQVPPAAHTRHTHPLTPTAAHAHSTLDHHCFMMRAARK